MAEVMLDEYERNLAMIEYLADAHIIGLRVPCRRWAGRCTLHKVPWPCPLDGVMEDD